MTHRRIEDCFWKQGRARRFLSLFHHRLKKPPTVNQASRGKGHDESGLRSLRFADITQRLLGRFNQEITDWTGPAQSRLLLPSCERRRLEIDFEHRPCLPGTTDERHHRFCWFTMQKRIAAQPGGAHNPLSDDGQFSFHGGKKQARHWNHRSQDSRSWYAS